MRKIILQVCALSVDGVIQTDGSDFEAYFEQIPEDTGSEEWITEAVANAEVLIVGRNTYLGMAEYFPTAESGPMVDALNRVPKVVLSKTLATANWGPVAIASRGLTAELERLRSDGDGYALIQGGVMLLQAVAAHDAADEYWLSVCPYVAGSGPRLFPTDKGDLGLELRSVKPFLNGIVAMSYGRVTVVPR
ncbi:MAG: dihydrofolate reductase family protein [Acidimicrobiales bacterium]